MPRSGASSEDKLRKSVDRLEKTISELPEEYPALFSPGRNMFLHFLNGIVYGLGMIAAVALVIPFAVLLINQVQWIPLIGDLLEEIITRMEEVRSLRGGVPPAS